MNRQFKEAEPWFRFGDVLLLLLILWMVAMSLCSCAPTVRPKTIESAGASWDGNVRNSGFIGFDSAGNGILTPHGYGRYYVLVETYGWKFSPPLQPDQGLTYSGTNFWIIDAEHLAKFATMNRWAKEGVEANKLLENEERAGTSYK